MTFCHKHPSAAYAPHCAECEIERLQAVNAELLAVLKEVDITDEELIYALGSNHANQIRSAIARAEQAEERP